ncbi:MAG: SUMF1/EgtB/PvdO family nonheme iron enzyme [Planctomycetaceae bacterium]|nr:SUMF1/EgtB/PvdO family nonheme iron enzyme [Planctomycetaceae bacterium]
MPTRFARIEDLFHGAVDLEPGARAAFLERECAGDGELLREVQSLLAADAEANRFLDQDQREEVAAGLVSGQLPRRLGPYRLLEVAGHGGMGLVYRAERADGNFEQRVAVKMLRPGPTTANLLGRFHAERRVLARLEHPGIARIFDAGEDEFGAPWLAMEFVDGEPIDRWCDGRRLDLGARVQLFLEVLAAVEHAHEQLVVHRDLKPDNILVDANGRPRLLDFGIAKVLEEDPDAQLRTQWDERALTPAYASPEQILGQLVGVRSDVYSLGVVLFELLCGCRPYSADSDSRFALESAIATAQIRPPSSALRRSADAKSQAAARDATVDGLARRLSGDLDRIAMMALEREPSRRYTSAADLAADLRAWVEGRPVRARGNGAGYRLSKLVRRRPLESALVGALTLGAVAGASLFVRQSLVMADQLDVIERLADAQRLEELNAEGDGLVPVGPLRVDAMESWLARAMALVERRDLHAATQTQLLSERGPPGSKEHTWRSWQAARLGELVKGIDALAAPTAHGLTVHAVAARLERARSLARRSIVEAADDWAEARRRVAAAPHYGGLQLEPVVGLLPLGVDPDGGLEAFYALDTGNAPERDADGRFRVDETTGLVLLLLPGGSFAMGAQPDDPASPGFDPLAEADEQPVHEVELAPFLLSKYEVTQGQWLRWTGGNPSDYVPGDIVGGAGFSLVHPVEQVSWVEARRALREFHLDLPTEAQWEYGARAGTTWPWSSGPTETSLDGAANLADRHAANHGGATAWTYSEWLDDGHTVHAPVGSFAPNPFGLLDMHGNVWEWVRDGQSSYSQPAAPVDGLRAELGDPELETARVLARGGGFFNPPQALRSSERYLMRPIQATRSLGLRPARALVP